MSDATDPTPAADAAAVPDVLEEGPAPTALPKETEPEAHLSEAFRKHVSALIEGQAQPVAGTEELVDDLKSVAKGQAEARQSLQQASQFAQSKQGELTALEGQATALMRVLKRSEDRAAQET